MFDLKSHPLDEAQIERCLAPSGSLPLSYEDLVALIKLALDRGWVVQTIEAYECSKASRQLRMDASCIYPHDEYSSDPGQTAQKCAAYIELVLNEVTDRATLIYEVWVDPRRTS